MTRRPLFHWLPHSLGFSLVLSIILQLLFGFGAHAGLIPGTYPVSSGTEVEIEDTVTVNGNTVSEGETGANSVITIDGLRDTVSQPLPVLEPLTFPANPSTTDATQSDSPFQSATEAFYRTITIGQGANAGFQGGGPFHIDKLLLWTDATVSLGAGTYFIKKLRLYGKRTQLIVTSEPVVLHIGEEFVAGDDDIVVNPGGTVTGLRVLLHADAELEGEEDLAMTGLIYGPNPEEVDLEDDVIFRGAIITGGEIDLEDDVAITYTPGDQAAVSAIDTEGANVTPPVADAGPDQTVLFADTVKLDGSGSTDRDGDRLTFAWSFVSAPPNSAATLSDPTAVRPTFVVDEPGTYEIQLIVNDGLLDSAPNTVLISTVNSPPVAEAGLNQTVVVTETVVLDGTNSADVDQDPLTYLWTLASLPSGSYASLSNAMSPTPSLTIDRKGTYVVELVVHDGTINSDPDLVALSTTNSVPVADPGPDQTLPPGSPVQPDGSGSFDDDADPLTYSWSFTYVPGGSTATFSDRTLVNPTLVPDLAGLYLAQLIVNDGTVKSRPDTVVLRILAPPVAMAGSDQTVTVGTIVTLDGTASFDPDGDPLTYQWTVTAQPAGSTATMLNPTLASPTIVPDLPGTYAMSLVVADPSLASAPDTVVVTAQPVPPPPVPGLFLTNPPDGAVVSVSPIAVSGLVSDPAATVTVNGVAANVTGGIFLADGIVLQEGLNPITIIGTDSAGNSNTILANVTFSPTGATLMNPIFGPATWVKQTSSEEFFPGTFVNCETSAQYQLVLENGMSSGTNRVTSGSLLLNGVELINSQELTAGVGQIIKPIIAQAGNDLEGRLDGPIGAHVQLSIECTANCLGITIDFPPDGATVNEPDMVVTGSVTTSSGNPVGVIVNQHIAKTHGFTYAIEGVPVREGTGTPGPTTVVAHVTNTCEQSASTASQVTTTQAATEWVSLRATPDRTVAPSLVDLRISVTIQNPVTTIAWDFDGDGMIDAQGPDLFGQTVTYAQTGIQLPRVLVTDDQGTIFEGTTVVLVEDPVAFEVMLNTKWSDMMGALAQGDIEHALSHILIRKRQVLRHDWTVLKDHLGELASIFNVPLQLTDGQGFRVLAQHPTPLILGPIDFPLEVEFILDIDGLWRVRSY